MNTTEFQSIKWELYDKNPIIKPPLLSPILADPSFIPPEDSPDQLWHLFAHSVHGIHQYISDDGINWKDGRLAIRFAMRPYLYKENGTYYLFYEKYSPFQLYLAFLPMKWKSHIEMVESKDLKKWSSPKILASASKAYHFSKKWGESVSNPCLVHTGKSYRLYYSSSLVHIPDCGFNEPESIGYAESDKIDGPYIHADQPILKVDSSDQWRNLSSGSIKVMKMDDGYVALQNGIYIHNGISGSAVLELISKDGIQWELTKENPILKPGDGWMKSHVYAVDFRYVKSIKKWHLYFNARDGWHWTKGKETIGLMIGS